MSQRADAAAADLRAPVRALLNAKLRPPPSRPGTVVRARMIDRLERLAARPLTVVSAPAGYGKTTAVSQWLAESSRTPAWVTPDASDDEPVRLWTLIATAVQQAGQPIARDVPAFVNAGEDELSDEVLPRIVAALGAGEITLVIDDFERIRSAACLAQIDALLAALPPGAHLVLITRSDPSLRLARSRATGLVSELRAPELAFTLDEATTLLRSEGLELSPAAVGALLQRCEGWPAGLYLAALTAAGWPDPAEFVATFAGNHRYIGDYLIEEVFSQQSREVRNFLLDVSILDRFCAPLCDELIGKRRSAAILRTLTATNLFLVPLDPELVWFRFHHLFRVVARGVLADEHPERVDLLHARAAGWLEADGQIGAAIEHALRAGRTSHAARMTQQHWFAYYDTGLVSEPQRWIRDIVRAGGDEDPATIVAGAWVAAVTGVPGELTRRLEQLDGLAGMGPSPDGAHSLESVIAMLRGQFGYQGPAAMLAAGRRAAELETDGSTQWHALANNAYGHALYVTGWLHDAAGALAAAGHNVRGSSVVRIQALAMLSLCYDELGRPERARAAAAESMTLVRSRSLQAMPAVSLAYAALGVVQARAGTFDAALATLERGLILRRRIPGLSPWPLIHHLLAMSRVAVESGDESTARALLDEAVASMRTFNDQMSAMVARVEDVRRRLELRRPVASADEQLTAREAEVLLKLDSVLSLTEIAAQLYISPNTAKTHAKSIYRKLGATSRSDALRIAREQRLI